MAANGGSPPESRDEIAKDVETLYEQDAGRADVINEITAAMGDGNDEGNKAQLIERLTTIRLLAKKPTGEDAKTVDALLNNYACSSDFDEGSAVDADDDRTTWNFECSKIMLKKIDAMQKMLDKSNFSFVRHELQYMKGARGSCSVCRYTEQEEDQVGSQSTFLMCVPCRTWVCKSSYCLMAHLKDGKGNACQDSTWERLDVAEYQQQYRRASEGSGKRAGAPAEDDDE